ncbi:hypothetical protein RMCBS344292_12685 [Rhizopus microsporus]|nr:hypothetical protein RMCBS344292_12685 [Rhizopus microsporus]
MYRCSPIAGERFYLRLLLTSVRGPKSLEDIRTVNGNNLTTQLLQQAFTNDNPAIDFGHYLIDDKLQGHDKSLQTFNLPEPLCNWQSLLESRDGNQIEANPLIRRALAFASEQALIEFNRMYSQLNQQQKHAFDTITSKIESDPSNSQFFLQGSAGTGKIFVYNTLCNYYKSRNEIVLCVASSGTAALLLPNGQTSHSLFKISSVNGCSTCNIRKDSNLAEMIRRAKLIIWDEVPMQHKYCFEAVHRTFQDICDDPEELYLFGGKPAVLDGDFAKIPPVIRRDNRADTVSASVKQSFLWSRLQLLSLTQNMRLTNLLNQNDIAFARFIANVSYDHTLYGSMTLPSYIHQTKQLNESISKVYNDDEISNLMTICNGQYFGERAILATRNDTVGRINEIVLNKMPGKKVTLLSTDSADINEA